MSTTPSDRIEHRLHTLRQRIQDAGLDGVVVVNAANRRYFSGFTGSTGWLIITPDDATLVTDGRYWERAAHEAPAYRLIRVRRRYDETLREALGAHKGTFGFESQTVTVHQFRTMLESVDALDWQDADTILAGVRAVKDPDELDAMRRAAALTDEAMARVPELLRPGMYEVELAWELEKYMREHGAEGLAFPIIVAFGENSASPHAEPGERPLQREMAVCIDMGARVDGYCADLTRSFWYGREPEEAYLRAWQAVHEAQVAALMMLRPGVIGRLVDAVARDTLARHGYKDAFLHSLGHGVGLVVHEAPGLNRHAMDPLVAGNVVTVEPGVYIAGEWGIRLEELAVVWDNGPEVLSHAPHWQVVSDSG